MSRARHPRGARLRVLVVAVVTALALTVGVPGASGATAATAATTATTATTATAATTATRATAATAGDVRASAMTSPVGLAGSGASVAPVVAGALAADRYPCRGYGGFQVKNTPAKVAANTLRCLVRLGLGVQ